MTAQFSGKSYADATRIKGELFIECVGVDKFFGDFQALNNVDINVGFREVVVIIGPSGSGKSTLIRCINRLEKHDRGRIVVDGIELSDDVRAIQEVRRETGMVFQQFNLFPHLTVLDNITLAPRHVRQEPKAEAEAKGLELRNGSEYPNRPGNIRASSPAASNSGWPSPDRWRCGPR